MNIEVLKTEYLFFKNSLNVTDGSISTLIHDTRTFLDEYCQNDNIDEIFVDNLLLYLTFLSSLSDSIYNINCFTNYLNFQYIEQPKARIYKMEDYNKCPDNYDTDIYVETEKLYNAENRFKNVEYDSDNE